MIKSLDAGEVWLSKYPEMMKKVACQCSVDQRCRYWMDFSSINVSCTHTNGCTEHYVYYFVWIYMTLCCLW